MKCLQRREQYFGHRFLLVQVLQTSLSVVTAYIIVVLATQVLSLKMGLVCKVYKLPEGTGLSSVRPTVATRVLF
jgi:hypothetical protein